MQGPYTKAQPCVPLISTMHGQPFLIPLTKSFIVGTIGRTYIELNSQCYLLVYKQGAKAMASVAPIITKFASGHLQI